METETMPHFRVAGHRLKIDHGKIGRLIKTLKQTQKMKVFAFPGQGSQKKGMGAELFDRFPEIIAKADSILGYGIRDLCLSDAENRLNQTQYTQPALYVVNALCHLDRTGRGEAPDFVAGHSLGEYNALLAAGVFDFETGLRLVQKRGELMSRAQGGGMAAVIGLEPSRVEAALRESGLTGVSVANYNSPAQTVISGPAEQIARAQTFFEDAKARLFIRLKVSGAFHSPHMADAAHEFAGCLAGVQFSEPKIPVLSNAEARPYSLDRARELLAAQITRPVRWTETVGWLLARGVTEFQEVGPGTVLTGLIRNIRESLKPA